jgi:NADH-quinone oxidoreductase subunit J
MSTLGMVYFYVCAALAVSGALAVVVARNPIRSAMGLLLLILSIAGLFLALHAQFLAAVQLIVYAGAIVVLFLFVIMLLGPSASPPLDHRGIVGRAFGGTLFALATLTALAAVVRATLSTHRTMGMPVPDSTFGGIDAFGTVLFSDDLAPFELSSALLMVAVIGAVAVAKGRQGLPGLSRGENTAAHAPAHSEMAHSGVFRHDIEAIDTPAAPRTDVRPGPAAAAAAGADPDSIPTGRPGRPRQPGEIAGTKGEPR